MCNTSTNIWTLKHVTNEEASLRDFLFCETLLAIPKGMCNKTGAIPFHCKYLLFAKIFDTNNGIQT